MKYNVYDFDKTIYRRDSTFDFYLFCVKKHPGILAEIPVLFFCSILFVMRLYSKTAFKEKFFRFLRHLDSVEELVDEFWNANQDKIAEYYRKGHKADDIVISASPEFLLKPICKALNVQTLIASKVDPKSGRYDGENCWGEEKLRRLREELPAAMVGEFYSDSLSDDPLAGIAEKAYLVQGEKLIPWPKAKA